MSSITDYIANLPKPDCAVSVNGNYLEDTVRGYRTSSVSGRNAISMEITETTIGNSNGARYQRKRDESRDLTVSFALVGADEAAVHKLSELLQKFLNEAESTFIFADEPTMYWIGTVSDFTEEWQNGAGSDYKAMTGEFTIHCGDPYRHAVNETTVETNGLKGTNTVSLTNNGTSPTPLYIESYMWDGSSYVGYSLQKDEETTLAYILGKSKDVDSTETSTDPVTVIDQSFSSDPEWTPNAGIVPPNVTDGSQEGEMKYSSGARASTWGDSTDKWHGPSLSHIVPASNGNYPMNWKANWSFDFDTGGNGNNARSFQSMVFADGGGDQIVSVYLSDANDGNNSELVCYTNRTKHVVGTIPNNDLHVETGGNITVEKVDSDVHLTFSMPRANRQNSTKYTNKGGASGKQELQGTANSNWNTGVQCRYYAWFEETATDTTNNTSTITWAANATQCGGVRYVGTTRPHAGIINVYINGTCVCSEHVQLQKQSDWNEHVVWESGHRAFTVTHEADGSKTTEVKIDFDAGVDDVGNSKYYWGDGQPYSANMTLSRFEKVTETSANTSGYIEFDKHYTVGNPSTTIRQMTWWTASWGEDYSETKDSDGNVTSTSGYQRFNNSILRSVKVIKYADTKTVAKENSVYFSSGDTLIVDASTNRASQNGTTNLNMVDITSEPLLLYPGTHTLKVAVDNTTADRPPTMRITYKERWK